MPDTSLPGGRFSEGDLRVGQVLSRAWSVFSGNFLKFSVVTGIAALLSLLIPDPSLANADTFAKLPLLVMAFVLRVGLTTLSQATVFYGAFQDMRRRPFKLTDGLQVGLDRFFPLLGLGLVIGLAIVGLGLAAGILFIVTGVRYASPLIFIPGVMLFLMWSMGMPVCVVERLGPFGSLARSRELTKGHRWKILGLVLVTITPAVIIGAFVGVALGMPLGGLVALTLGAGSLGVAIQIVSLIWNAIWTAFLSIVIVVTYHDLRVAKEGVDTEQIAAVFE
jgi:hypothetical protein